MTSRLRRGIAFAVAGPIMVGVLATVVPTPAAGATSFDINGYIVGSWRNVDNKNVYVVAGSGRSYTMSAGSSRQTGEGCPVTQGQLLYTLQAKQDVGGYLNGGDYLGPWTYIKKDDKGVCQTKTIAPGAPGFYEGATGFVPTTGDKTAENPDGQYLKWFCAYTGPYTHCATLSRIGKGFVGVTTTTTTTAKPATRTTSRTSPVAHDLSVTAKSVARFGSPEQPDGATNAAQANTIAVDLLVTGSTLRPHARNGESCPDGTSGYKFVIDGVPTVAFYQGSQSNFCLFRTSVQGPGPYVVKVSVKARDGKHDGTSTIVVKDKLVFGLGDSNGAGEGNPPWADSRCHRSVASFESQTAGLFEQADPQSSITFVHLACSGASIANGMLGGYEGITDPGGPKLLPQLDRLRQIRGTRTVDAVVMSIGINDLGFSDIVKFCVWNDQCYAKETFLEGSKRSLQQIVQSRLAALKGANGLFARLAAKLKQVGVEPGQVYISQYFDPTHDERGTYCNPLLVYDAVTSFSQDEAKWASEQVVTPLNIAVRQAADTNGWRFLDGTVDEFYPHGYCASDTWIVHLFTANFINWNAAGPLHATRTGNTHNAQRTYQAMKARLS